MASHFMPGESAEGRLQFIVTSRLEYNGNAEHQMVFVYPGKKAACIWCEMMPGQVSETKTLTITTNGFDIKPPFVICCWILPPVMQITRSQSGGFAFPDWNRFQMPPFHFIAECDTADASAIAEKLSILAGGTKHAPNEFCRTDTIYKQQVEACITPAYPVPTKANSR